MNNWGKAGVWLAATITAGCLVLWFDSTPREPQLSDYPAGSLGRAVAEECDPRRRGAFEGSAVERAITCRDLAAQNDMAISTQRVVWLSWAQLYIGIAGSIGVIWTVILAIRSMALTRIALEQQRTATRLELRPRFERQPIKITMSSAGELHAEFRWMNIGTLPARHARDGVIFVITPLAKDGACKLDVDKLRVSKKGVAIHTRSYLAKRLRFTAAQTKLLQAGTHALQIAFAVAFDDEMGGRYRYTFRKQFSGPDLSHDIAITDFKLTDPALNNRLP